MSDAFKQLFRNKGLLALTAVGILLLAFGASGGTSGGQPGGTGNGSAPAQALSGASQNNLAAPTAVSAQNAALQTAIAYETAYDHELERMIDQIAGISEALVMVRVDSTAVEDFGKNLQTSRSTTVTAGTGNRTSTTTTTVNSQFVTVTGQNGSQVPVVVEQQMPHIIGVLVVAKATDTVRMQWEVTNAVQDVLGIPLSQITVLPRK